MKRVRGLAAGSALVLAAAGGLCWSLGEIPQWMSGGTQMVPHPPLAAAFSGPSLTLAPGATILVISDSNATSSRIGGAPNWPSRIGHMLGHGIAVRNMSRSGSTVWAWQERYRVPAGADLCVIAFGSNDAASRGWLGTRHPVGTARFADDILRLIGACREHGTAQVLVLAPVPTGSPAMERRVAPYRTAAREAAIRARAQFADPMEAFAGSQAGRPYLSYDALHLTARAHQRLAAWLASRIQIRGKDAGRKAR
ncbi:SGNH/GDSL hydrolase family protein [Novosphingobium sp. PC22D]|uniref:SGNH/GDSL hydrolase family protein n=1 Tax=Novosphingobium sp. PC22D TaxID=1962403 RepID=UPI001145BA91|nr:SGNH/GDSL hydrolase family protein [Novosphingobium sp. PC22D]